MDFIIAIEIYTTSRNDNIRVTNVSSSDKTALWQRLTNIIASWIAIIAYFSDQTENSLFNPERIAVFEK